MRKMSRNTVLFGNPGGGSGGSGGNSRNLLEFKAGKMTMHQDWVHPDKRKGLVYIHQSEDSLMHCCWKDRQTGLVEDDLLIFPEEIEFKPVPQCTTGRVFLLKFKNSNKKMFFWMQEPKSDRDEEICKKVNELFNNPPSVSAGSGAGGLDLMSGLVRGAGGAGSGAFSGLNLDGELQNILEGMNPNDLMRLLSMQVRSNNFSDNRTSSSSTATDSPTTVTSTPRSSSVLDSTANLTNATLTSMVPSNVQGSESGLIPSSAPPPPPVQLSDLQNILQNLNANVPSMGGTKSTDVDLELILDQPVMAQILADDHILAALQPFMPNIPSSLSDNTASSEQSSASTVHSNASITQTVKSPQFRQALNAFGAAFSTGQLASLISQFNLGHAATQAAQNGDLLDFARALQETSQSSSGSSAPATNRDDSSSNNASSATTGGEMICEDAASAEEKKDEQEKMDE